VKINSQKDSLSFVTEQTLCLQSHQLQDGYNTDIDKCITVVIAVILPLLLWKSQRKQFGKLPPGPAPYPLLGNLLQFDVKEPFKFYLKVSIQNNIILLCLCLAGHERPLLIARIHYCLFILQGC